MWEISLSVEQVAANEGYLCYMDLTEYTFIFVWGTINSILTDVYGCDGII
jgi:hypothetical protein